MSELRETVHNPHFVTGLSIVEQYKPKYTPGVLSILNHWAAQAEEGKVSELVLVARNQDGTYVTEYSGCDDLLSLVGHLEAVKLKMLRRMERE